MPPARSPGLWPVVARSLGSLIARSYLSDARLAYLVGTRYPTLASLAADVVNQSAYLLGRERVLAPSAVVTVELTNACNLRCAMCPQAQYMKRPKTFFPLPLYRELLAANPEIRRIILADWGGAVAPPRRRCLRPAGCRARHPGHGHHQRHAA